MLYIWGFTCNIFWDWRLCYNRACCYSQGKLEVSSSHNKSPKPKQTYAGNLSRDTIGKKDAENTGNLPDALGRNPDNLHPV